MADDEAPPTQVGKESGRKYQWVFLFNFDPDNETPFSWVSLDHFNGTDFPFNLISGHLGLEDRLKPRGLPGLAQSKYGIFAKVETGQFWD